MIPDKPESVEIQEQRTTFLRTKIIDQVRVRACVSAY